ncbi:MAG: type III-A CRISPR-associated protein Cas10/Csm1, partial [Bacteroidales bacterium]|nr:type III-A CRISPR-associated protein Cas10/Csm1 [Bacteroidales bacterium]
SFKKIPLKSIFDIISLNKNYPESAKYPTTTKPLTIEALPTTEDLNYEPDYSIWNNFIEEFNEIPDTLSPENFIQTLDALLHKYTYCIPSSTIDEPDISLYDHLKTTAFLAIALYDFYSDHQNLQLPLKDEQKPFILLGGDISGIQDFIYDIPNKGAAKQLKGRSFYIHLITETIVRYILKEFNLLHLNVVYSSGGNFYLLLPNLKNVNDKINKINTIINQKLLEIHGTAIYLAMEYEEIAIAHLKQKSINKEVKTLSELWDYLISEKLTKAKNQRYLNLLKSDYDQFFEPQKNNYESNHHLERKLENLGKKLKSTEYVVFTNRKHPVIEDDYTFEIGLDIYAYLYDKFPTKISNAEIIKLNKTDFIKNIVNNNTYRFEFYGGNDYPTNTDGTIKTFEELAEGKNFDRLGVLRMDVDNLGKIFAEGFKENLRTFSRLTSLSRNLDLFFKGYLNTIWNKEDYKKDTYILYSGGDDLFVLGRWDKVIDFAYEVKQEFFKFTKSNEFGISGGISIEKPKYPIRRAAFNAGKIEGIAKDFCIEPNKTVNYTKPYKKNAFALFGVPLSWQSDFEKVLEIKNHLIEYQSKSVSHSFYNAIKMFYGLQEKQQKEQITESWRWLTAYYLQRAKERLSNKDVDFKYYIEDLKISIFADTYNIKTKKEPLNSNHTFLKLLAIAARWAELELKTMNN